jgi:dihydrofolate reductase
MREIVAHLIITLDGVVKFDTVQGAVLQMCNGKAAKDLAVQITKEDAVLLGRKTYDEWSQFWPTSNIQPFANHINTARKYVVTNSLKEAPSGSHGPRDGAVG